MANPIDVNVLDWQGNPFSSNRYEFVYNGTNTAFVPQITVDGLNQLDPNCGFWVRYYLFNQNRDAIKAVVLVGPDNQQVASQYRAGAQGLTDAVYNILGLENVYDSPDGIRYIGYEIYPDDNGQISIQDGLGHSTRMAGDGNYVWAGYPVINEGLLVNEVPVFGTPDPGVFTVNPYIFRVNKARPTVTFLGNTEVTEYDGSEHTVSGYTLSYTNDQGNRFRNAVEDNIVGISIPEDTVSGTNVGIYSTNFTPGDFSIGEGSNAGSDINMWMNFDPIFNISRQIKLIIEGEGDEQNGIGTPVSASKYYDGLPLTPVVNAPVGAIVWYSEDGVNFNSTDPIGITDAGSKYVTVKIENIPGQNEPQYIYYSLQVLPRSIYISSDSKTSNYTGHPLTCDWITIQGHVDESQARMRMTNRYGETSPQYRASDRSLRGIPLLDGGDSIDVIFHGSQVAVGISNNTIDYIINSSKPNNYDVRIDAGTLKVNVNAEGLYVFIRGNTKGTGDIHYESNIDRVCYYDNTEKIVSDYKVIAVTTGYSEISDPDHPGSNIRIPAGEDRSDVYGVHDIDFVGDREDCMVSGLYINSITDTSHPKYWESELYESSLSSLNFRNNNPNFSSNTIHFEVTPNKLKISKRPITINIEGNTETETFNMVDDGTNWIPEEFTVSGYRSSTGDTVYNDIYSGGRSGSVIYKKIGETTPSIPSKTACVWNELDVDGKWYMELGDDIHPLESDYEAEFEDGFINTDKNFEVTFALSSDGWLLINPLDVTVYIRGTRDTIEYDGDPHRIEGEYLLPEIWWRSDCEFFNSESKEESIAVIEDDEEVTYYRALHDKGYFEWSNDGDTGAHTDAGEYPMNLSISDFHEDANSEFDIPGDFSKHIHANFNTTFKRSEDGLLKIDPYSEEVSVHIIGNTRSTEFTGLTESVAGYAIDIELDIYSSAYIDKPAQADVSVSGVDPGTYMMGINEYEFSNTSGNFNNVRFYFTDGWLLIVGGPYQDPTGEYSYHKVFDDTYITVDDPEGTGFNLARYTGEKDPDTGDIIWTESSQPIRAVDSGTLIYKMVTSDSTGNNSVAGEVVIDPLELNIRSMSRYWIYDGQSHDTSATSGNISVDIANTGDISDENMADIRSFIGNFAYSQWATIENPGSIENYFEVTIPFQNGTACYSINGTVYGEGSPNVIINLEFGVIGISEGFDSVTIRGKQKTIIYDGEKHTLTGYYVEPPLDIPIKSEFIYENTVDVWEVSDEPYYMGLDVNSFNWPDGVPEEGRIVEDGWIKIDKRNILFRTGSDTGRWSDDDPAPVASNNHYTTTGLAGTDHIEISGDWLTQDEVGSIDNEIDYVIMHGEGGGAIDVTEFYEIENEWGKLTIYEASDANMYYRILGIRKSISGPDTEKVHISGLKRIDGVLRIIDEDRFYPILHKLVPIPEDGTVEFDDVICVIPLFKHGKKIEDVTWVFENRSTGKKIFSKLHQRPIFPDGNYGKYAYPYSGFGGLADTPVLNITPREMDPGYYDVVINYKMGGAVYSQRFSSIFMIKKKS